jgi:hypothetical protein
VQLLKSLRRQSGKLAVLEEEKSAWQQKKKMAIYYVSLVGALAKCDPPYFPMKHSIVWAANVMMQRKCDVEAATRFPRGSHGRHPLYIR